MDDHIRNIWLVGNGGGNNGESYDLLLYAAEHKIVLDSVEKRNKKGYMFLYADELIFPHVLKNEVSDVFGDKIEKDIPIAEVIEDARKNFNVFVIWPRGGEDRRARAVQEAVWRGERTRQSASESSLRVDRFDSGIVRGQGNTYIGGYRPCGYRRRRQRSKGSGQVNEARRC